MLVRSPCRRRRVTLMRRGRLSRLTAREPVRKARTRCAGACWITVRGGWVLSITRVARAVMEASSATLRLGLLAALEAMFSVADRSPTPLSPMKPTVTRHELPGATGDEQPRAVNSLLVVDRLPTVSGTWPVFRSVTLRVTLLSSERRPGNVRDVVLSEAKALGGGVAPAILPSTVNRSLNSPPDTAPVKGSVTTGGRPGPETRMEFVPVGLPTTVCGVAPSPT